MELCQANQLIDQTQREKSWLFGELGMSNKVCREDRAKDCQEIEELRRVCCAEADRARQLKIHELSVYERALRFRNCMISSDLCLPHDTRNSFWYHRKLFFFSKQEVQLLAETLLLRKKSNCSRRTSALFETSKNLASSSCG